MKESDLLATSFISAYGSYCYVTMPFGLKNADATYQRCMQQCFADQIDLLDQPDQVERPKPTIAVYVDDIVVKTAQACDLIANLAATFMNLRRFNMKLNPKNVFLGFQRGSYLDTLCPSVASRPTLKRTQPSRTWALYTTSRAYKGSPTF